MVLVSVKHASEEIGSCTHDLASLQGIPCHQHHLTSTRARVLLFMQGVTSLVPDMFFCCCAAVPHQEGRCREPAQHSSARRQFLEQVKEAVKHSARRELVVFVHGYNVKFEAAIKSAAQVRLLHPHGDKDMVPQLQHVFSTISNSSSEGSHNCGYGFFWSQLTLRVARWQNRSSSSSCFSLQSNIGMHAAPTAGADHCTPPRRCTCCLLLTACRLQLTFDSAQDYSTIDMPGRFQFKAQQRVAVAFDWASNASLPAYGFVPCVQVWLPL